MRMFGCYFLFLTTFIGFANCKKQAILNDCLFSVSDSVNCMKLPIVWPTGVNYAFGYVTASEGTWTAPCYNPSDPNQFVYLFNNYKSKYTALILADTRSCTKREIYRCALGSIISGPSLNSKEEILFESAVDLQVYKVSLKSGSPQILTHSGGYNNYPTWNKQGSYFFDFQSVVNYTNPFILPIYSDSGLISDTLFGQFYGNGDWSQSNVIAAPYSPMKNTNKCDIGLLNSQTKLLSIISTNTDQTDYRNSIQCLRYSPDERSLYFATQNGLYKMNMADFSYKQIVATPLSSSSFYVCFSISPDGLSCLAEKQIFENRNEETIGVPTIRNIITKISLSNFQEKLMDY